MYGFEKVMKLKVNIKSAQLMQYNCDVHSILSIVTMYIMLGGIYASDRFTERFSV